MRSMKDKHIGLDFDNTLVRYDDVFYKCALDQKLIPPETKVSKNDIRDCIKGQQKGNEKWIALQGFVYGEKMGEAVFEYDAGQFIRKCRGENIKLSIISHKTEFDAGGCGINLRESAMKWMRNNKFFSAAGLGFSEYDVFFESTREDKIARIIERGCTHFIDDLLDVFEEKTFPSAVVKMYYNSKGNASRQDMMEFSCWREIYEYFFDV